MTKNKQIPYYIRTSDVVNFIEGLNYTRSSEWGEMGKTEWLMFFSMGDPDIEYHKFIRLLDGFSNHKMARGCDKVPRMLHDWARKHKYRKSENVED